MKQALRGILVNSIAITLGSALLPGIDYGHRMSVLIIAAIMLGVANTFIRPILALVLLPINIITLGIAGLFMNTLLLFIVTLVVPGFNVIPFTLTWTSMPLHISLIWSYILCSFIISLIGDLVRSIVNS